MQLKKYETMKLTETWKIWIELEDIRPGAILQRIGQI